MNIRLEQPKDYREVENLTREAFWNVYRPGCTEHYVLNQYRTNPDFIPELDFVMEDSDKIIGFDLASKMKIHYHAEPMEQREQSDACIDSAESRKRSTEGQPRESEVPYFLAQELIPGYWGNREGTYCPPKGYFVADENPERPSRRRKNSACQDN